MFCYMKLLNVAERSIIDVFGKQYDILCQNDTLFSKKYCFYCIATTIYHGDYSINRVNFHGDLNFMIREVREQKSVSLLFLSSPVSPWVSARACRDTLGAAIHQREIFY